MPAAAAQAAQSALSQSSPTTNECKTAAGFCSAITKLSEEQKRRMDPAVWRKGCPVALADLRVVTVAHKTFAGSDAIGSIVVHQRVAKPVAQVFRELYDAKFPIASMQPIEHFDGDDNRSTLANNTSGFNCRRVQGLKRFSEHAFGLAIDINPLQNPDVHANGTVLDPKAIRFIDRVKTSKEPGVIASKGLVVTAFKRIGWGWGGNWPVKDYQHFSLKNR